MTDCHSSYGSGLLPPTELVAAAAAAAAAAVEQFNSGAEKSSDQMSTISSSNTSTSAEQPSPPYSGSKSNDQFSPPESYMDQRTETPSSDQLHLDFSSNNGYSPDGTHSSDRDESPDTVSTSSGAELHADSTDIKPMISADDSELQRQLLRLQSFAESAASDSNPQLNLLQAFSNSLLGDKLSASLLAEKLKQQVAAAAAASSVNSNQNSTNSVTPTVPMVPLGATLPHPITSDSTPTKRKRQRRNPVWPYFEVIDGTARCKQCLYSTKSVFSTNLKVHLRSHHRADYDKVIQAEDALNLNALLLSGNSNKLFSPDPRKRIPPMTSSILMTINKLANQTNNEDNPLNSVLRQTLAAGTLSQQLQQVQNHLAQQQKQQQQQQNAVPQFPLNAANLAALNNLARNQFGSNNQSGDLQAPHGTDANGMPQPKRRRLRRHPVWMFFRDLEDRMVGCINCNFRTGSAFSTNLKMHLKAHHKEDYERVLKLEDDMRIEEGIFGPPNKMKSELIDFIRGGGNASTPQNNLNSANPKASPLVQQILNQTLGNRTGTSTPQLKKESSDDDPFNGMSMSDKLAALVGLAPPAGSVEGEVTDDDKSQTTFRSASSSSASNPFEELRRAAERIVAANMGLQPPPQEFTMVNLNGSIVQPEEKASPTISTTDICDDKKSDRDRALARFWLDQGGNDDLLSSEIFKELLRSLAPEYEIPAPSHLAALVEEEGSLTTVGLH